MQIHDVIRSVGLTKKAINLYEQKGLIQVKKEENGYRDYDEETIEILWKIKVLRKLDFCISDIKEILEGNDETVFQEHFDTIDRKITQCQTQKTYIRELYEQRKPDVDVYQTLDQMMDEEFNLQKQCNVDIQEKENRWTLEGIYVLLFISFMGCISSDSLIQSISCFLWIYFFYQLSMLRGPVSVLDLVIWNTREKIVSMYRQKCKKKDITAP